MAVLAVVLVRRFGCADAPPVGGDRPAPRSESRRSKSCVVAGIRAPRWLQSRQLGFGPAPMVGETGGWAPTAMLAPLANTRSGTVSSASASNATSLPSSDPGRPARPADRSGAQASRCPPPVRAAVDDRTGCRLARWILDRHRDRRHRAVLLAEQAARLHPEGRA